MITPDIVSLPRHIAIVMDGNGRWAKKRGMPRLFGHRAGVNAVKEIVEECSRLNIGVLTLYALSTENWIRPKAEIIGLMSILKRYVRLELPMMMRNNVKLTTIGDQSKLPADTRAEIKKTIEATSRNTGLTLNLALNYGARDEMVRAINRLVAAGIQRVDETTVSNYLDTAGLPDPDLFIRTSGEMRLSNFMLWQIAYTELHVTPVLWPDFKIKHLHEAIADFRQRGRRYGGVDSKRST
ncbi:MAG: isoprenyl transferase [Elusimicrobia bacterium]|nr:isoprenyl transferase [Elusimicrobiota bacterium]